MNLDDCVTHGHIYVFWQHVTLDDLFISRKLKVVACLSLS